MIFKINHIANTLKHSFYVLFGVVLAVACVDDSSVEVIEPSTSLLSVADGSPSIFEDEAVTVSVNFIEAAKASGTVDVSFSGSAVYGTDFTTEPAGSAEGISIAIATGDENLSIAFNPVTKLGTVEESKTVNLTFGASGGVSFGVNNTTSVTIVNRPEIIISGTISDFGNTTELTSSESQSIDVSGIGLTGDVEIIAPDNFEISTDNSDFEESVTLAAGDINADAATVYMRFSPAFDVLGAVSESVSLESADVENVSVAISGTGVEQPPTIILDAESINLGAVPTGSSTASTAISVSGYRLSENVTVAVAAPFEISLDDDAFSSSIMLDFATINSGDAVVFYARFSPTSGVDGDKSETLTVSSAGATSGEISLSGSEGLSVIAYTSFEEPSGTDLSTDYTDPGDAAVSRALENTAEADVNFTSVGGEMGFQTIYISTGGNGATDGDDFGVTNKSSIVGDTPEGGYTDGVQGYVMDDTDGIMRIVLDEVDVTGLSTFRVTLDYLFNDTDYEVEDYVTITAVSGIGTEVTVVSLNGDDIEAGGLDPEPHIWNNADVDLSSLLGNSTVQLIIEVSSDSGNEEIYFDNIKFLGN